MRSRCIHLILCRRSSATVPHVQNRESSAWEVNGHRTLAHAQLGGLQAPSSLKPAGFQLDVADSSSWKTTRQTAHFKAPCSCEDIESVFAAYDAKDLD